MANITMNMIKELRERTAAGVVDCKTVLTDTNGDIEKAVEELQKRGIAKAAKKHARIAAEGKIGIYADDSGKLAAITEVNCETDFVSKGEQFVEFCANVAHHVADKKPTVVSDGENALSDQKFISNESITVEQAVTNFTASTGEKTTIRRFERYEVSDGRVGHYIHDGGRICVLIDIGADEISNPDFVQACEDIAMHIAAMNPPYVRVEEIPSEDVSKQQEIFEAQVKKEGKPEKIVPKIVEGKIAKWKKDNCLVDQIFVKDNETTVGKLIEGLGGNIRRFARFEVGEGMQKRVNDLASEVAEMVGQ